MNLADRVGFEPTTTHLTGERSTAELQIQICKTGATKKAPCGRLGFLVWEFPLRLFGSEVLDLNHRAPNAHNITAAILLLLLLTLVAIDLHVFRLAMV